MICFAIALSRCDPPAPIGDAGPKDPRLLRVDDREHFVLAHDEVLVAVQFDFLAGVLAEEDRVPFLHVERNALVLLALAEAHGNALALLGLFLGGVRDDDPANLLFAFFEALDDHTIM